MGKNYGNFLTTNMMINFFLVSLFFLIVNCQLAFIWLNQHHFQCAQNTKSYREAVSHQYLCISSLTWTCIMDAINYSSNSVISLDYFCGFIDVQNAIQPYTIWNVNLKPNIHVQFVEFVLSHNYWYCDYEYLKILSNNKSSTFCGKRLPWASDACDSLLTIIFLTRRVDSEYYQVQMQYYGSYLKKYEHFVMDIQQSSMINTHLLNTEQNVLESFHFISNSKRDSLHLKAINMCNTNQVVCYDGPGIKSPTIQGTDNHSVWECQSSTFQMVCEFSSVDPSCMEVPHLHYHAVNATEEDFNILSFNCSWNLNFAEFCEIMLAIPESTGTTKYIAHSLLHAHSLLMGYDFVYFNCYSLQIDPDHINFFIKEMSISLPYMMYEGYSCMYGGIYIIRALTSGDDEVLSHCAQRLRKGLAVTVKDQEFVVVIIHYGGYSGQTIKLVAQFDASCSVAKYQTKKSNNTINIIPYFSNLHHMLFFRKSSFIFLQSSIFNLPKHYYFQLTLKPKHTVVEFHFEPAEGDLYLLYSFVCTTFE